ncbi:hypothetical protein [Infirmifilum sp.]|uniref:hypothetical protein n=1 Tax=Infirmifilum sp. TaxID=2856575 RepID=UPI003D132611
MNIRVTPIDEFDSGGGLKVVVVTAFPVVVTVIVFPPLEPVYVLVDSVFKVVVEVMTNLSRCIIVEKKPERGIDANNTASSIGSSMIRAGVTGAEYFTKRPFFDKGKKPWVKPRTRKKERRDRWPNRIISELLKKNSIRTTP